METKPFWKSKTIWLAVLQGVLGIVVAFTTEYPMVGALLLLKSSLDMFIRVLTETPIN